MHELGVAQSILDIVRAHVPSGRAADVRAIRVKVGDLSGVLAESLDFCFSAIVSDTPFRSAHLALERVPVECRCAGCTLRFSGDGPIFACPSCGSAHVEIIAGDELQVIDVELDEPTGAPA